MVPLAPFMELVSQYLLLYLVNTMIKEVIGGITELITSWIADVCFGVGFWDYSHMFLNIMGHTILLFMAG